MSPAAARRAESIHSVLKQDARLRDCVQRVAETRAGIVVFVDGEGRFRGLLTAGDLFRLIARGVGLDDRVWPHVNTSPITVESRFTKAQVLRIMVTHGIGHVPVLRPDGTVDTILTQSALLQENLLHNRAVIMAGGEGRRLRPLTERTPKAMLRVNGRPLLERLIERLRDTGVIDITLCVRYQAGKIRRYFGDGSALNVNIDYVEEREALGTCGAISLIEGEWSEPFFVFNCDVLCDADLTTMYKFHALNRAQLTVAVKDHAFDVPFGIVESDHERVLRITEKPQLTFHVNAGMYLLSPEVKRLVPGGCRYDMTDLIRDAIERGAKVCSFPVRTAWLDVGDKAALQRAQSMHLEGDGAHVDPT
jgi:dTDP-glucose pyrophosphorylase